MDTILELYETSTETPKYKAVAGAIRQAIAAGALAPGDKLPPVRDLAWRLGMTPGTVARAYTCLTDEGTAQAEVGRGTFVAQPPRPAAALAKESRWLQFTANEQTDQVNLYASKLPDMGQVALINDAFARLAERPPQHLLNYPSRVGFAPARRAVLRWLASVPLGPVDETDLVLSHGGQSGVTLVLQSVLRGRRPVVLVEDLSYPGFRRAARLLRAEVVSVPMDDAGILPEALDQIAKRHEAQVLCTCPEIHNPTVVHTALDRREAIARVARQHNLHVLEDDCYRMSLSRRISYRALLPDLGWYVSSMSKSLSPALRIGFVVAPKHHAADLRRVAEDGFFGLARPLADVLEDLLTRDETFDLIAQVSRESARYVRTAVNVLGRYDLSWSEDISFLWLRLPDPWRSAAFVQAAEARGVQLRPGEDFALRDATPPHAVRIGVNAQVSLDSFEAAMLKLRDLLDHPPEQVSV